MATTTKIVQLKPANVLSTIANTASSVWALDTESDEIQKVSDDVPTRTLISMTQNTKYLFFFVSVQTE